MLYAKWHNAQRKAPVVVDNHEKMNIMKLSG